MAFFCIKYKQVGHVQKNGKNKNKAKYSIKFGSCYQHTKGANGIKAKFIGASIVGPKKSIWVPKNLVANHGEPKQVWVPNRNWISLQVKYKAEERYWWEHNIW